MARDDEALHNTIAGTGAALVGGGALTMAFFPFLLPILILTIAFVAPLLVIGLVPALVVGAVVLAARAISRALRRGRRTTPPAKARPRSEIRAGSGAATAS